LPPDPQPTPQANFEFQPPVPDAVRRASQRADTLARAAGAANVPPEQNGAVTTTVVTNGTQPGVTNDQPNGAGTEQEQRLTTTPDSGAPDSTRPPESRSEVQRPAQDADWQQRYLTLQGKYDREVPSLLNQQRQLEQQVQQMQMLLANVRTQPAPTHTPLPAPPPVPAAVPREDVESYGEDLVNATRRWARAEVDNELRELRTTQAQLRDQLSQLSTRTETTQVDLAKRGVEQGLEAEVPNWRVINNDPGFLAWLSQIDPFSQRKRHDMLGEAYTRGDVPRTIAFFRAYSTEQTAVAPVPGPAATHTPAPRSNGAGRMSLGELAAPGRGTPTAGNGGAPEKRSWTPVQIAAFYRDVNKGLYVGREAEQRRVEQDLFAAASEGRVR
jgi:hypothetical protein